jgi:hypothetical protein
MKRERYRCQAIEENDSFYMYRDLKHAFFTSFSRQVELS